MMLKRWISLAFLMVAMLAFAAEAITVEDLLKDPKKYDGKTVTVKGKVVDYDARISKKGREYTVFKLKGEGQVANVYLSGKFDKQPDNGDIVEITGLFRIEKKVGSTTYKNEIDLSNSKALNKGLKILKTAAKKSG